MFGKGQPLLFIFSNSLLPTFGMNIIKLVIYGKVRVMHFPQSLREAQGKIFVALGRIKIKRKKNKVTPQPPPPSDNEQSLTDSVFAPLNPINLTIFFFTAAIHLNLN